MGPLKCVVAQKVVFTPLGAGDLSQEGSGGGLRCSFMTPPTSPPPAAITPAAVSPPQAAQMFKQRDRKDALRGTFERKQAEAGNCQTSDLSVMSLGGTLESC